MNRQQLAPWLLFIAIAAIYLLFPTRSYYWDGIVFAQAIEDATSLNPSLVHPNHLIYNFAGYLFYKLLYSLGTEIRALTALQILNSILSAACARIFFSILLDTLRSLYFAVCLTLIFAFSATWWKFSTDANAYIPSVLFLLISFYLVLPNRKVRPLLLAVTFFIGLAFHQLAVVMWPVLALGVYLQDGPLSIKQRVLNAFYFTAVAGVLIVATYSYLFYLASGAFDLQRLLSWTASYSPDADTRFGLWSNLQYSLRGQVRLFFGGRLNLLKGLVNPLVVLLIAALVSAAGLVLFNALRSLATAILIGRGPKLRLETRQKTVLLLSLLWTFAYLVFLYFWLPQNTFYRIFYLPGLVLLLGLLLSAVQNRASKSRTLAMFVIAVALANFLFLIYPFSHVEKYPPLSFALQMNREWPAGTVIYYGAQNSDQQLVRYFNPSTQWKQLRPESITAPGDSAWLETTAIDQISSTAAGAQWLNTRARKDSLKELNDGAYRIRFIQVY
ncbi:MAG TPA: hypothetical protein VKB02_12365 [Pyrinomonadaceae bacterium]|nr:hypothetical protein [Pyrinomonadaceae bacterium]